MPRKIPQTETESNLDQQLHADQQDSVAIGNPLHQTEVESTEIETDDTADTTGDDTSAPLHQTDSDNARNISDDQVSSDQEQSNGSLHQTEMENADNHMETADPTAEGSIGSTAHQTGSEINGIQAAGSDDSAPKKPSRQTGTEEPEKPVSSVKTGRRSAKKPEISTQSGEESDSGNDIPEPPQSGDEATAARPTGIRQARAARRQRRWRGIVGVVDFHRRRTVARVIHGVHAHLPALGGIIFQQHIGFAVGKRIYPSAVHKHGLYAGLFILGYDAQGFPVQRG